MAFVITIPATSNIPNITETQTSITVDWAGASTGLGWSTVFQLRVNGVVVSNATSTAASGSIALSVNSVKAAIFNAAAGYSRIDAVSVTAENSYDDVPYTVYSASRTGGDLTIAYRFTGFALTEPTAGNKWNMDNTTGNNISTTWSNIDSGTFEGKLRGYVNGTLAFTYQLYNASSSSDVDALGSASAIISAMGSVSPANFEIRLYTLFKGSSKEELSSYSTISSTGSITKTFSQQSTVAYTASEYLSDINGFTVGYTLTNGGAGTVTHGVSFVIGASTIATISPGAPGSKTYAFSAAESAAINTQLATSASGTLSLNVTTYVNGSQFGGISTATATVYPSYSTGTNISANWSIGNNPTITFTTYTNQHNHDLLFYKSNGTHLFTLINIGGFTAGAANYTPNLNIALPDSGLIPNNIIVNNFANPGTSIDIYVTLSTKRSGVSTGIISSTSKNASTARSTAILSPTNIESALGLTITRGGYTGLVHDISIVTGLGADAGSANGVATPTSITTTLTQKNNMYANISSGGTTASLTMTIITKSPDGNIVIGTAHVDSAKTISATLSSIVSGFGTFQIGSTLPAILINNASSASLNHSIELRVGSSTYASSILVNYQTLLPLTLGSNSVSSFNLNTNENKIIFNQFISTGTQTQIWAWLVTKYNTVQLGTPQLFAGTQYAQTAASIVSNSVADFNIESALEGVLNLNKAFSEFYHTVEYKITNPSTSLYTKTYTTSAAIATDVTGHRATIYTNFAPATLTLGFTYIIKTYYFDGSTYKQIGSQVSTTATGKAVASAITSSIGFTLGATIPLTVSIGSSLFSEAYTLYSASDNTQLTTERTIAPTALATTTFNIPILTDGEIQAILNKFVSKASSTLVYWKLTTKYGTNQIGDIQSTSLTPISAIANASTINTILPFDLYTGSSFNMSRDYLDNILTHEYAVYFDSGLGTQVKPPVLTALESAIPLTFSDDERRIVYARYTAGTGTQSLTLLVKTFYNTKQIGTDQTRTLSTSVATPTLVLKSGFTDNEFFATANNAIVTLTKGDPVLTYQFELVIAAGTKVLRTTTLGTTSPVDYTLNPSVGELTTIYATMPSSSSVVATLQVSQYYGAVKIQTTDAKTATIKIDLTIVKPTYTSIIAQELTAIVNQKFNAQGTPANPYTTTRFIKKLSNVGIIVSGVAAGSGVAAAPTTTITYDAFNATSTVLNTGALTTTGSQNVSILITDARGAQTPGILNTTILDYEYPTIANLDVVRCLNENFNLTVTNFIGNGTTTVTATVSSTSTLKVGRNILVTGAIGTEQTKLNGYWSIQSITSATTFTFVVTSSINVGTLTTGLGQTAYTTVLGITSFTSTGTNTITATLPSNSTLEVGRGISITGATGTQQTKLNGYWFIASKINTNQFTFNVFDETIITSGTYNTTIGTTTYDTATNNVEEGDYAELYFNSSVYSTKNGSAVEKNKLYATFEAKLRANTNYTPLLTDERLPINYDSIPSFILINNIARYLSGTKIPYQFAVNSSYDIKITIKDEYTTLSSVYDILPTAFLPLMINEFGISAGKVHSGTDTNSIEAGANIQADGQFISSILTGTPPVVVTSTTLVPNLNTEKWGSQNLPSITANGGKLLALNTGATALEWVAKTTTNALTINNGGVGAASGSTFNGSAAVTISYNTVGAAASTHVHGNITNGGAIGSTADQVVTTTTSGVLTTLGRSGIDSRATFPATAHTHLYASSTIAGGAADSTKATLTFTGGSTATFNGSTAASVAIPTTLPASDVYAWAKASVKPTYTASDVGLGNVNNSSWVSNTSRVSLDYNQAGRTNGSYACESTGTNGPGYAYLNLIHQVGSGDVGFQIAGGYTSDNMFFRGSSAVQSGGGYTAWRTVMHNGNFLNYIYPIGAIYISISATSPATLFGGTWSAITDRFLVAAGSTFGAGGTGGALSHVHSTTDHVHTLNAGYALVSMYTGYVYMNRKSVTAWTDTHKTSGTYSASATANNYAATLGGSTDGADRALTTSDVSHLPPYYAVYMWTRTA